MITLTELTSFVLRHRTGTKAFRDYSVKDVESLLSSAMAESLLIVDCNKFDDIFGLVIFQFDVAGDIHVVTALCVTHEALLRIIKRACEIYNRASLRTISFQRRGKARQYNLEQFLRKYENGQRH